MSNNPPRSQERPPNFLGGHGGETAFYGKLGSIIQPKFNPPKLPGTSPFSPCPSSKPGRQFEFQLSSLPRTAFSPKCTPRKLGGLS